MHRLLPSLLCLLAFALVPLHAKRSGPEKVEPVTHEGVIYSAPLEDGRRGIVRATEASTGKLLWEKEIYTIKIRPDLEEDVQWGFINSLRLEKKQLLILVEKHHSYSLDLKTR